jgi:MinD superfamily P-loop ATPase
MTALITNLLRRPVQAAYCESCSTACDSACRSAAIQDRARSAAAAFSPRF